jgi:hypothetical protein
MAAEAGLFKGQDCLNLVSRSDTTCLSFSKIGSAPGLAMKSAGKLPTNCGSPFLVNGVPSAGSMRTSVFRIKGDKQCHRTRSRFGSHVLCSGGATLVAMVQSTDLRDGDDPSSVGWLDRSGLQGVFLQRQVCAAAIVIAQ